LAWLPFSFLLAVLGMVVVGISRGIKWCEGITDLKSFLIMNRTIGVFLYPDFFFENNSKKIW